jgi:endogenous inhibitor of DNA gyrase (YacG/DUF329 family)
MSSVTTNVRRSVSERCRDVDLNRWLSNSYAIPGKPDAGEDGRQP